MRVVVYDDEDLEPITVIKLPLTERDIEERGRRWRVPVPLSFAGAMREQPNEDGLFDIKVVDLYFEPLVRRTYRQGEQRAWMCVTRAAELAMLLKPDWLPGQRGAINYLVEQNDRLANLLMAAIARL